MTPRAAVTPFRQSAFYKASRDLRGACVTAALRAKKAKQYKFAKYLWSCVAAWDKASGEEDA